MRWLNAHVHEHINRVPHNLTSRAHLNGLLHKRNVSLRMYLANLMRLESLPLLHSMPFCFFGSFIWGTLFIYFVSANSWLSQWKLRINSGRLQLIHTKHIGCHLFFFLELKCHWHFKVNRSNPFLVILRWLRAHWHAPTVTWHSMSDFIFLMVLYQKLYRLARNISFLTQWTRKKWNSIIDQRTNEMPWFGSTAHEINGKNRFYVYKFAVFYSTNRAVLFIKHLFTSHRPKFTLTANTHSYYTDAKQWKINVGFAWIMSHRAQYFPS